MRHLFRLIFPCLAAAAFIAGCGGNEQKGIAPTGSKAGGDGQNLGITDSSRFTTIQWVDSVKDFGKIQEGQKLEVSFRFRNTGNKPLVIEKVQPSCGCTVAEQPTEPVSPGNEGQIKASFNSEGRIGVNHKSLLVTANTKGGQNHSLQFVVEVEKKQ